MTGRTPGSADFLGISRLWCGCAYARSVTGNRRIAGNRLGRGCNCSCSDPACACCGQHFAGVRSNKLHQLHLHTNASIRIVSGACDASSRLDSGRSVFKNHPLLFARLAGNTWKHLCLQAIVTGSFCIACHDDHHKYQEATNVASHPSLPPWRGSLSPASLYCLRRLES